MALSQRLQRTSRRSTMAKASFSDDEDAITPCSSPPPEPQQQPLVLESCSKAKASPRHSIIAADVSSSRKTSSSTRTWHLDPAAGEDLDDARLWRRMLDIQREFHCYNSARMAAALLELEMGVDVGRYAPPRACLELLNDSVSDLPEEDKERLVEWLHENSTKRKRSTKWKRASVF
ncbi:hypothetical protein KVR01_005971 [Diaporthe batatas]|uniref:uncharacterized protein n=1 Tax=Diaporthe batatas TaxID=748121 RepID=UPI001D03CFE1|nr:uncharacterized protein KVR01_005971 [Diaporthe batatas]KAG8164053.1 hypothetical protein KVR01_005971 [Diaporthe batatas]